MGVGDEVQVPRGQEWLCARRGHATASRLCRLFGFFGGNPELPRIMSRARAWEKGKGLKEKEQEREEVSLVEVSSMGEGGAAALLESQSEVEERARWTALASQGCESGEELSLTLPKVTDCLREWHRELLLLVAERLEITHGSSCDLFRVLLLLR